MKPETLIAYMQASPKFAAMVVELLDDAQKLATGTDQSRHSTKARVCGNALALGSMLELRERIDANLRSEHEKLKSTEN